MRVGTNIRIGFLSSMSIVEGRFPIVADVDAFKNVDVLLLSSTLNTPHRTSLTSSSINIDGSLGTIFAKVSACIKRGGNILIPCDITSNIALDIIPVLASYLKNSHKETDIPINVISSVAAQLFMYCSSASDFLSPTFLHNVTSNEEDTFTLNELYLTGRLKVFPSITSALLQSKQSIVFVGHPSCRFGDVLTFLKMWGNNSQVSC